MQWSNQLTRSIGIEYPIIQAPMFGVTTPEMVIAASRAGALGSLSLGDLPPERCSELIRLTAENLKRPFAVNIFVNNIPKVSFDLRKQYSETKTFVEQLAAQHDLKVTLPELDSIHLTDYREQIDVIITHRCKVVSFTFGNLDTESIKRLKDNDVTLIGTCTSVAEAIALEESGIDIICVQGLEAGGHRGSFDETPIPAIGGLSLLPQVKEHVRVPLIYAGGLYNASTLYAAKLLGASGFQVGSLLLNSKESALLDFEKTRLSGLKESDIVLTRSFSGRYARGIKNKFIEVLDAAQKILPYPYQNKLTGELRKVARANKNADFVNIWTGQSIHAYSELSTADIIRSLIKEVEILHTSLVV
ncbi:NAD(P)H-dependent flavin oxidoreductase [Sphingobacterium multivorum]|uniref:NAD(P)H-dependent flavin oxidoreductase n=1 Tax=Sphingobacterium multivorum TaxID=28454 RepID=UPI0028AD18A7|nr:nitronate monooxygenase [Sphingobacterium multivorum]